MVLPETYEGAEMTQALKGRYVSEDGRNLAWELKKKTSITFEKFLLSELNWSSIPEERFFFFQKEIVQNKSLIERVSS